MPRTRAQLTQSQDLLLKISLHQSAKDPASFLPGENDELERVPELISLVENELLAFRVDRVSSAFEDGLKEFLATRWNRIVNTPLCYTLNPSHPLNKICIQLAIYLDSARKNTLLMPGVEDQDVFGHELDELQIGEFIIADNNRQFIALEGLVSSACQRVLEQEEHTYVTCEDGNIRPLSETELQHCGKVISMINFISRWYRTPRGNFLQALTDLREGLRQGDVHHRGQETDAGKPANEAIAVFHTYYSSLSEIHRQFLSNLRFHNNPPLGEIIGRLFRPRDVNYRQISYCIGMLGGFLQNIIDEYSVDLSGLELRQQELLYNLINIVKSQLCGHDLPVNPTNSIERQNSFLNPELTFNENEYVVSFIAPQSNFLIRASAKIIVEGIKNGRVFVGSYYVTAQSGIGWPLLSDQIQNTRGVFTKVKIFESYGYAQIPQTDVDGSLTIGNNGNVATKFDQLTELRQSLSRSHQVPAENVMDMIQSIKHDAAVTEFAQWVYNKPNVAAREANEILADHRLSELFIQFEPFGRYSLFGHRKDNCVTWCESKLAIAGCGQHSAVDNVKAKPVFHVTW